MLLKVGIILSVLLLPVQIVCAEDDGFDLLLVPAIIAAKAPPQNSSAKPGASNTGVTQPLIASGSITVTANGAVIQNLDVDGCIRIEANSVTIRNVRINCNSFYGINIVNGYSNALIEDVEIFGMQSSGILGSNFILRRANIHDSGGDATKPGSNVVIEDSWFHRLGTNVGSHSDGVQMVSGTNVVIRSNNIDMPYDLAGFTNSQCMIIQTNNGPIDNILIEANWLNGGGYCVQINDKGNGFGAPTNVQIINNKFGRDCQFGILRFNNSTPTLSGNIWEDTEQPIGIDYTDCDNG